MIMKFYFQSQYDGMIVAVRNSLLSLTMLVELVTLCRMRGVTPHAHYRPKQECYNYGM